MIMDYAFVLLGKLLATFLMPSYFDKSNWFFLVFLDVSSSKRQVGNIWNAAMLQCCMVLIFVWPSQYSLLLEQLNCFVEKYTDIFVSDNQLPWHSWNQWKHHQMHNLLPWWNDVLLVFLWILHSRMSPWTLCSNIKCWWALLKHQLPFKMWTSEILTFQQCTDINMRTLLKGNKSSYLCQNNMLIILNVFNAKWAEIAYRKSVGHELGIEFSSMLVGRHCKH